MHYGQFPNRAKHENHVVTVQVLQRPARQNFCTPGLAFGGAEFGDRDRAGFCGPKRTLYQRFEVNPPAWIYRVVNGDQSFQGDLELCRK
jgi:hypothetical protein